ncbi:UPF0147 family protein [Candidatus Woesearchaeota archaeon]|nr:UPF0147 family protein [Candidatus Woesearchaeota archaeon]
MDQRVEEIIALLKELQEDNTVPRNVKLKLQHMQASLEDEGGEISLKVNKILSDVEDIANDINLPMFIRTQIWNLTSMLEGINA